MTADSHEGLRLALRPNSPYVLVMQDEQELDEALSTPRDQTRYALASAPGDIIVLGAGGKMGPSLARMAKRAADDGRRVIAVSRFSSDTARQSLEDAGIETISGDLLDRSFVASLPDAPNVVYMAGQKFGTSSAPSRTWMMNVIAPSICAERYGSSRIVAFSTGNVYPLVPVDGGGATEDDFPNPTGDYAASCLGRERIFEYAAENYGAQVAIVRLNYACDLRYGVLTDIALKVLDYQPVSLTMGYVNAIWQRDANCAALELFAHVGSYPLVVNVTGPDRLSVRELATEFGRRFEVDVTFDGDEAETALLSNTTRMQSLLQPAGMPSSELIELVANWVQSGNTILDKRTEFETRDGRF